MTGIGFIGAGNHGRHHIREFARLPEARLACVYDLDAEAAARAAADFPPLRAVPTCAALLSDPMVEGVVIATPAETHRELAQAALAAGRHVLLEKPMAATPEDAAAIATLAEARPDLTLLVGHCERFNRAFIDVRKALTDGRIGEPRFAWASRISPLHLNDPTWQLGALDTAVHDIDLILWYLGARPLAVTAQGTTVTPELTIPDQVTYQIQFENGALAQGHIGWIPFSRGYPMSDNAHPRLFLAGTEGVISLDLWQRPVAVSSRRDGSYFWPDDVLVGYGEYATEVTAQDAAFLRAVSEGHSLPITPREAANAVRVAHAAHASLQANGARVAVAEETP